MTFQCFLYSVISVVLCFLAISALVCLDFACHLLSSVISYSWRHLYPAFAHVMSNPSQPLLSEELCQLSMYVHLYVCQSMNMYQFSSVFFHTGVSDGVSGIQNLMETFLSSAAAVAPPITQSSTSCNGAATNGYLHSPVIKQAEAV